MFKKILVSIILGVTMFTQVANAAVTILPIPTPTQTNVAGEFGQVQGMITAVSSRYVIINTATVTFDGDTTINYNGGLTALSIGEMVNYSYTVDVDGVILATVMDVYPAETITSTDRVSRIDVDNSTAIVALTLYRGPIVDFYQNSGIFVHGAGTQTSYGCQLVNYNGYINPTTGHIIASGWGYMSDVPVNFVSPLTHFTVNTPANFYSIDISQYGMPCLLGVGAAGLPPGLTNNNGLISGTPTTPGTYTVTMNAMYGDHNVNAYSSTSGIITIVVDSGSVLPPPPPAPVDTAAPVITMNGGDEVLTIGDIYTDAGATCVDDIDTTCTVDASSNVDTTTAGTYTVNYSATDIAGNTSTATRTVTVNPAPVIIPPCSGTNEVITNAANARAGIVEIGGGPSNGGIAVQIFQASTTIISPLTTSTFFKVGNLISYVGTMDANNLCITTSATVSAPADTTAPIITVNGGNVTLTVGNTYTDAGATTTDAVDGIVTVTSTNNVDTTIAGVYTVNYSATDAAGNTSTATRTVTVNPAPVVTPPTTSTGVVSTGVKVEGTDKIITAISTTTINIGNLIIRITPTTLVKLNKNKPLKVGDRIEYKGTKNTDGSVTATIVKIQ